MTCAILVSQGDSAKDDRPAIQAAIDGIEAQGGGVVRLTNGTYYIGPVDGATPPSQGAYSILLGDNVHLVLDDNARIVRRFSGSWVHPTIRNRDITNGNSNIRITGGTILSENPVNTGRHLVFIKTSDLEVVGIYFGGVYGNWNTSFSDCTDVLISNVVMDSGAELTEDGLHFHGGQRIRILGCSMTCGDDCIALVHESSAQETNMSDVVIADCYLHSRAANALKILVQEGEPETISRVSVSNIVAKSSGAGLHISDLNDSDRVSNVSIDQFYIDLSDSVGRAAIIRGCSFVTLSKFCADSPFQSIGVQSGSNISLLDCQVINPRGDGETCVYVGEVGDCPNLVIQGGSYIGARAHAIHIGSVGIADNWSVVGVHVQGAIGSCLVVSKGTNGVASGNRLSGATGWGIIEVVGTTSYNLYVGNNVRGNTNGISTVGTSEKTATNLV